MPCLPRGLVEQDPNAAPVCVHDPEAVAPVAHAVEVRDLRSIGGERRVVQPRAVRMSLIREPATVTGKEDVWLAAFRIDGVDVVAQPSVDDLRSIRGDRAGDPVAP